MKRAYSYLRFSRLHQSKGDSTRRQRQATEDYCQRNNLALDDSLQLDDEGVSAFRGRNVESGSLGRFIAACEAGSIPKGSALVVESLDRLSRQPPRKTVALLNRILDAGIEVHLTMVGKIFRPDASDDGVDLILAVAMAMRSHEESETKSRRLKEAFARKREKIAAGEKLRVAKALPWWLVDRGGKMICPPERRAVVKRIFESTAAGQSSNKIAWALNAEGIATWRPKASEWVDARVRDLIVSDAPLGILAETPKTRKAGRSYRIEGYYPAIISPELASEARAALKANRRAGRPTGNGLQNLLRGLARYRGLWLRFSTRQGRLGTRGYYEALNLTSPGVAWSCSARQLEGVLLAGLAEITPADLEPLELHEVDREAEIKARLHAATKKASNLLRAVEAGSTTAAKKLVEMEAEIARLETELGSVEKMPAGSPATALRELARVKTAGGNKEATRARLCAALRGLVSKVEVGSALADVLPEKRTRGAAIAALARDQGVITDPTNTRGKRPLAILVSFRAGGQRLILRGIGRMPPGILSVRAPSAVPTPQ